MTKKLNKNEIMKTLRSYSMVIVLVVIAILFQWWTGGLTFKPRNLTNIVLQQSYIVILILGMLPVILTGNVDLSVGSTVAFVGAVAAVLQVRMHMGTLPTLLISLVVGAAIGAWNGLWIAKFDIPAFIVTLSSQLAFRGLTRVVLDGASIGPFDDTFRAIAGSFLPDVFKMNGLHLTSIILGAIACLVFIITQISGYRNKVAHGVPVKNIWGTVIRTAVICAAVMWLTYMLAIDKGYPTVLIIMLVLEPVLLCLFATTPGKLIFGIRVTDREGKRLSYTDALERTWSVLWDGMALGIPLLECYFEYRALQDVEDGEELPWEEDTDLTFADGKNWRWALFFALYGAIFAVPFLKLL